jgi:hypothetical protein
MAPSASSINFTTFYIQFDEATNGVHAPKRVIVTSSWRKAGFERHSSARCSASRSLSADPVGNRHVSSQRACHFSVVNGRQRPWYPVDRASFDKWSTGVCEDESFAVDASRISFSVTDGTIVAEFQESISSRKKRWDVIWFEQTTHFCFKTCLTPRERPPLFLLICNSSAVF